MNELMIISVGGWDFGMLLIIIIMVKITTVVFHVIGHAQIPLKNNYILYLF